MQDAVAFRDVLSCIILINNINAYILFDSGATYSFVSKEFAKLLNLSQERLGNLLNIEVTNKEVIFIEFVYCNY